MQAEEVCKELCHVTSQDGQVGKAKVNDMDRYIGGRERRVSMMMIWQQHG